MGAGVDDCAAGGVVGEGGIGVSVDEVGAGLVDGGYLVGQLLSLSSSPVVLVPLMSWTLMARVMVGEHGEGDVWGVCVVAGDVDGEGVVSGRWGVTFLGWTLRWWWGCCI